MFWAFVEVASELSYCPLADFGAQHVREGKDIYAKAIVAQPLTGDLPLRNAAFVRGKIVVMERGVCDFVTKVQHAQDAGAVAVVVANTVSEDPAAAFVMDAGSRQSDAASIEIPALMMPHNKAAAVFEQIRRCYLDRSECALTIRFLGAQAAALVMEQTERAAKQRAAGAREQQRQQEMEAQRLEAAKQLRSRLSQQQQQQPQHSSASRSTVSTPASTPRAASVSSLPSLRTCRADRQLRRASMTTAMPSQASCIESSGDETSSAASSSSSSRYADSFDADTHDTHEDFSENLLPAATVNRRSSSKVLNHWCPMTTALLVMDVQNYFALHENEPSLAPHAARGVHLAYYKHIHSVVVPTIQDVLLASRASEGIEVLYSVVESATRDGRDRSRAHKHAGIHIARAGFGAQILARVAPSENDIVIPRTGINIFESTNLDYTLRNLGVSHLVVLGISTLSSLRVCIQSALEKGYQVTVLREGVTLDAVASSNDSADAQRQRLDAWFDSVEKIGCQVQHAAAFVRELQAFNEHDEAFFQVVE